MRHCGRIRPNIKWWNAIPYIIWLNSFKLSQIMTNRSNYNTSPHYAQLYVCGIDTEPWCCVCMMPFMEQVYSTGERYCTVIWGYHIVPLRGSLTKRSSASFLLKKYTSKSSSLVGSVTWWNKTCQKRPCLKANLYNNNFTFIFSQRSEMNEELTNII